MPNHYSYHMSASVFPITAADARPILDFQKWRILPFRYVGNGHCDLHARCWFDILYGLSDIWLFYEN